MNTNTQKQRSALVATRHFITGQVHVLPEEALEAFTNFTKEAFAELKPQGFIQTQQVMVHVQATWQAHQYFTMLTNLGTLSNMEEIGENLGLQDAQTHNAMSLVKGFRQEVIPAD